MLIEVCIFALKSTEVGIYFYKKHLLKNSIVLYMNILDIENICATFDNIATDRVSIVPKGIYDAWTVVQLKMM